MPRGIEICAWCNPTIMAGLWSLAYAGVVKNAEKVRAVFAFSSLIGEAMELRRIDEFLCKRDLLNAGHLQALALFQRLDEDGAGEERVVGAGVEPGDAAAHALDLERAALEICAVDVGDLVLAAGG